MWATLTMAMVLTILFFGLRSKMWSVANSVRWVPDEKALRFQDPGMAYVDDFQIFHSGQDLSEFTIEMVVKTENVLRIGFRPILMMHDGDDRRQLAIWQWGTSVIVMNGDDYDYARRWPRVSAKNAFSPGKISYLTVVAGKHGTRIYVDGTFAVENSEWKLSVPEKGKKIRLVIGNSVYGRHSWAGDVYGVAVSGAAILAEEVKHRFRQWMENRNFDFQKKGNPLSLYTFQNRDGNRIPDQSDGSQHLEIPTHMTALKIAFLSFPWHAFRLNQSFVIDAMINVIGFVPLGFLLYGWLLYSGWSISRNQIIVAMASCLILSLAIEMAQAFIPGRFSSLMDVILNTLGGGLGVFLFSRMVKIRSRRNRV